MARLSPFVPFGLVLAFQAWLWPFWPVFGLCNTLYNLTFVFSHRTVKRFLNMVYKRVCRNCPILSCGAKYLVRLANHLADVHQLDHIQRRHSILLCFCFCLKGSFSLRCASTSFSLFARRISTISHSHNLLFPTFEVTISQLTSVSWFCL